MKICSKCKKEKALTEFSFKNKAKGVIHAQCKECTRLLIKNHYNSNREYYLGKANSRNSKIRLDVLTYIQNLLLGSRCIDCGESDVRVLEFDHTNKIPKFKAVSSMIRARYPLEKVKEEINKCEIRCANCHRKKTSKDFRWFRNNMRP